MNFQRFILLILAVLVFANAAPADAAEKQVWGFVKSGTEARLFYGVPDSGNVTIVFTCEGKRISIVSTVLPASPRKGRVVRTTLTSGAVTAAYYGKIGRSESDDFYVDTPIPAERKVLDVLKTGTSLTISIVDKKERLPLRGITRALATFEAACFR